MYINEVLIKKNKRYNCFIEFFKLKVLEKNLISLSIKSNILFKDKKSDAASRVLKNFIAPFTATIVKRLLSHFKVIGRTNMDEFAMGSAGIFSIYGSTINPLNERMISGGSSSGSAVSVATDMVLLSLGSDTGGSVRLPAAYCGIIGFKPSYISRRGLIAFSNSLDQIGFLSKSLFLIEKAFNLSAYKDEWDLKSLNFKFYKQKKKIKVLFLHSSLIKKFCSNFVLQEYFNVKKSFEKNQKIEVKEMSFFFEKNFFFTINFFYSVLSSVEAFSNLSRFYSSFYYYKISPNKDKILFKDFKKELFFSFGSEVKRRIKLGEEFLSSKDRFYQYYYKKREVLKNWFNSNITAFFDYLVLPSTSNLETTIDNFSQQNNFLDIFNLIANLLVLPAITLPCLKKKNSFNLPFSFQILSTRSFFDKNLLNFVKEFKFDKL